jgi:hypothetical protein
VLIIFTPCQIFGVISFFVELSPFFILELSPFLYWSYLPYVQHVKIYLPCNFEVNLITHLGVIALFSSFFFLILILFVLYFKNYLEIDVMQIRNLFYIGVISLFILELSPFLWSYLPFLYWSYLPFYIGVISLFILELSPFFILG